MEHGVEFGELKQQMIMERGFKFKNAELERAESDKAEDIKS